MKGKKEGKTGKGKREKEVKYEERNLYLQLSFKDHKTANEKKMSSIFYYYSKIYTIIILYNELQINLFLNNEIKTN